MLSGGPIITIISTQGEARAQRGRATYPGPQLEGQGQDVGQAVLTRKSLSRATRAGVSSLTTEAWALEPRSLDFGSHHWVSVSSP